MVNTEARGLRSSSVRRRNLTTVMRLLHLEGPMTRSLIGQRTGLTRATVGTLVGDLVAMGLSTEQGPERDGKRGRPSSIVHPESQANVVVGIELMVDSIGVAVIGLGGTTLRSVRRDRTRGGQTPEASVADATKIVDRLMAELPVGTRRFGTGVAVPALVTQPTQQVVLAPNLGWRSVDLVAMFRESFGADHLVTVGNEADLGALGETRRGGPARGGSILFISGEVGVGGGIIADGSLLSGTHGFAGEIGHTPLNPGGERCSCGAIGCFETELGEAALLRRAGIEHRGRHSIEELVTRAEQGDPIVLEALVDRARWLALGLSGPLNLLDLDMVVLGGLLGRVLPFMHEALAKELASRALLADRATAVVAASLGEDAALVGAAEHTWDLVLDDVAHYAGPLTD